MCMLNLLSTAGATEHHEYLWIEAPVLTIISEGHHDSLNVQVNVHSLQYNDAIGLVVGPQTRDVGGGVEQSSGHGDENIWNAREEEKLG